MVASHIARSAHINTKCSHCDRKEHNIIMKIMKKLILKIVPSIVLLVVVFVSCSKSEAYKKKLSIPYQKMEPQEVHILEYNKALFSIDTANFEEELEAVRPYFKDLLGDKLEKRDFDYVKAFVTDTFIVKLNDLAMETFPDIEVVEDEVRGVYQHFAYYYPEVAIPQTYTYVSGVDYESGPVMIGGRNVMISLDYYLNNKDLVYDKLGIPRYISRRCQPAALTRDLAEALYFAYVFRGNNLNNALAEMIEQGKKYYFIEAMNPSLPDSVILGYSTRQMDWANYHEGQIWAYVVEKNMLYANTYEQRRMLFNDGPFTTAFGEDSPSRIGDFLGLKIVRSFMSNNDETLTNLMKMTDDQDIFQRSQYKPRK